MIPRLLSTEDYYAFGMIMPGRRFSAGGSYRYGFNGKEEDDDVKGDGNQQDYGMRIYDPRLGRFLSVDPLTEKFPWLTSYQFSENNPIRFIDLDGAEIFDPFTRWFATDAAITITTQPTSVRAKVYGALTGVGGSVQGAVEGTVNLVKRPVQSAKGMWRMATNTPTQNLIDHAIDMADKYGDLPEPVQDYAVYGHFVGDVTLASTAFKGLTKPNSLGTTIIREAAAAERSMVSINTTKYLFGGNSINTVKNRTTTVLGRFKGGTEHVIATGKFRTGVNNGGLNVLSIKNWEWKKNAQWLNEAISRNDIFRVVSDPRKIENIWENGQVNGTRTTFGREVEMLEKAGYEFNDKTFEFVKPQK
jgi:RHS repeat-associated protein